MATNITDSLGVVEVHDSTEIHVTKDGKFAAVINGARVQLGSKAALRKRIAGHQRPIACIDSGRYGGLDPLIYNVVRVTAARQVVYLEERTYPKGEFIERTGPQHGWYFYDEAAYNELKSIAVEIDRLRSRRGKILAGLRPVNAATFADAQREIVAQAAEREATASDA